MFLNHERSFGWAPLVLLSACSASLPAPPAQWQRSMQEAQVSTLGSWTMVQGHDLLAGGELLAVTERTLVLAQGNVVAFVPRACVEIFKVFAFKTNPLATLVWGVLGTGSSVTHGGFVIFSLPVWLMTSAAAISSHSQAGVIEGTMNEAWTKELRKWARFPQGLPSQYMTPSIQVLVSGPRCGRLVLAPPVASDEAGDEEDEEEDEDDPFVAPK
jgi:hypothetical protein